MRAGMRKITCVHCTKAMWVHPSEGLYASEAEAAALDLLARVQNKGALLAKMVKHFDEESEKLCSEVAKSLPGMDIEALRKELQSPFARWR